MSLKAKIEAVIYAAEEPVTLVQLVGLLGEEAQAELDALAAQQSDLPLETMEPEEVPSEETPAEGEAEAASEPAAEVSEAAEPVEEAPVEAADAAAEPAAEGAPEAPVDAAKSAEAEKKAAREREKKLREYFREILGVLVADYANGDRGLEVREVAGGFRFGTKPEYHDAVRGFVKSLKPPMKLSLQALETLAVVAYKQPVTAPEVGEIRGVDSGGVLASLLTRKLITTAGRKQVIGRPILYKTTKEFLVRFGLKDINELPSIEEFEKMAGELNEAVQEEIPMDETAPKQSVEDGEAHDSAPIDEINAAPEPTHVLHDSPEDLMADDSSAPEGSQREHADPSEVEPMAEQHEAQADGTPDGSPSPTTDDVEPGE